MWRDKLADSSRKIFSCWFVTDTMAKSDSVSSATFVGSFCFGKLPIMSLVCGEQRGSIADVVLMQGKR